MSARGWVLFAAVSVLWGIPYGLIKVAVDGGISPMALAAGRVTIGAAALLPFAKRAGVLGSIRGRLGWIALYALAEIAAPFPLLAVGETNISSSFAAILIATSPMFVALLALRFDPTEKVNRRRLTGLCVGLGGVVALVGIDAGRHSNLLAGDACVLAVALCYSVAPMILKRHLADVDPRATMAVSLALAALVLVPTAAIDLPERTPSLNAMAALAGLGILCTAAALALYGALIVEVGAGKALVVTYLNPLVAVAFGVLVLSERPGAGLIVGLIFILAGAWLSTDARLPRRAVRTPRRRPRGAPLANSSGETKRTPILAILATRELATSSSLRRSRPLPRRSALSTCRRRHHALLPTITASSPDARQITSRGS